MRNPFAWLRDFALHLGRVADVTTALRDVRARYDELAIEAMKATKLAELLVDEGRKITADLAKTNHELTAMTQAYIARDTECATLRVTLKQAREMLPSDLADKELWVAIETLAEDRKFFKQREDRERERCLRAVEAEPELPGAMPVEMYQTVRMLDREGMAECGEKFRRWRVGQRLTLHDVSALTGVSVPMLSLVESGQRRFSRSKKVLIARRLGVSLRALFEPEPIRGRSSTNGRGEHDERTGSADEE